MLWPHLFSFARFAHFESYPPFAIEILRYGTRDQAGNFFLTQARARGRYISDSRAIQGYSSACTVQFPPFILSSSPQKLFFRFTALKGIIFFLKTSYLNLKHAYKYGHHSKASVTSLLKYRQKAMLRTMRTIEYKNIPSRGGRF